MCIPLTGKETLATEGTVEPRYRIHKLEEVCPAFEALCPLLDSQRALAKFAIVFVNSGGVKHSAPEGTAMTAPTAAAKRHIVALRQWDRESVEDLPVHQVVAIRDGTEANMAQVVCACLVDPLQEIQ